jgi:hypothetical protein
MKKTIDDFLAEVKEMTPQDFFKKFGEFPAICVAADSEQINDMLNDMQDNYVVESGKNVVYGDNTLAQIGKTSNWSKPFAHNYDLDDNMDREKYCADLKIVEEVNGKLSKYDNAINFLIKIKDHDKMIKSTSHLDEKKQREIMIDFRKNQELAAKNSFIEACEYMIKNKIAFCTPVPQALMCGYNKDRIESIVEYKA